VFLSQIMISRDELVKQISNTIGKTKVLELSRILKEQAFALRDLIDLTFDLDLVVGQCFDWMIDAKVKIAVKVFASEALFNLRNRYPWIKEELANQVKFLMRNGSPAIQSRGRKLLAHL
jgi:hypothetical protein